MANERKDSSEESTLEQTEEEQKAGEERAQQDNAGEDLTKLLEDSRAKAEEHWDQLLRMRAEMDNLNKRHTRELENAHKFALDNFVRELLLVWDSLELGLSASHEESADIDKLREGMDMTVKVFADAMEKFGVEQIDPQGEPFNPEYHQAMSMQARDDMPPNHVVTVVQKGCMLNGRLVRPAMVIVSQAPS